MTTGADRWRATWLNLSTEAWAKWQAYQNWKRTPRGRLAMWLYPFSHRAYLYLARRDGWASATRGRGD